MLQIICMEKRGRSLYAALGRIITRKNQMSRGSKNIEYSDALKIVLRFTRNRNLGSGTDFIREKHYFTRKHSFKNEWINDAL